MNFFLNIAWLLQMPAPIIWHKIVTVKRIARTQNFLSLTVLTNHISVPLFITINTTLNHILKLTFYCHKLKITTYIMKHNVS